MDIVLFDDIVAVNACEFASVVVSGENVNILNCDVTV